MRAFYTIILFLFCIFIILSIAKPSPKPTKESNKQAINQILKNLK